MLKTKEQIKQWLDEMGVENYTINKNLTIDVKGSVDLSCKNLKEIPVQFNKVGESFSCSYNKLKSLKGAPKYVGWSFYCGFNLLKSLKGAPEYVGRSLSCYHNPFKFVPKWMENN